MRIVSMQDAKAHLSHLVDQAARGESFVIAKAGRPMVKVVALDETDTAQRQPFGFLAGQVVVPDDFDAMGADEVASAFGG